jgi:hypothetical protein
MGHELILLLVKGFKVKPLASGKSTDLFDSLFRPGLYIFGFLAFLI